MLASADGAVLTRRSNNGERKTKENERMTEHEDRIGSGDLVQLKVGGPFMVVEQVVDAVAHCSWFDKKKVLQTARLQTAALRFAQP